VTLPEVRIDVGFTASGTGDVFTVGHPTLGQVGVVPIGADDIWTDVTPYVRSWSVRRGAGRGDSPTLRFDPGTCSVEFNDGDRRFDPENLLGPYVVAGVTQVEPMRRFRIRAVWGGVTYPIFYGYADDWVPSYQGNSWTYTTAPATDASKIFAGAERAAVAPIGAGELSGARINRILDTYGWPAGDRVIGAGDTTLQATTLAGNMLGELQLVQDTEQGELYIDAEGRVVFRGRRASLTDTRSAVSQATFGDGGYDATGEIPYADAVQSTPDDTLVNSVDASRTGGTEQHVEDAVSVARYTRKSHTRNDLLMETDDGALQWAQWIEYQFGNPARRFAKLAFNTPTPQVEAAFWPALLGRDFGDRITVIRRPAGGGDPILRDCFVRGVEHQSDGASWASAFTLQSADRYSFFVVGDPNLGRVGMNAVAY
jgi:hypothetical protein